MQCGQSVQLLDVKQLVHHVTSRLYKVKVINAVSLLESAAETDGKI